MDYHKHKKQNMPHFVLDCSEKILDKKIPNEVIEEVFKVAVSSGLFKTEDVKVRINPFKHYTTGGSDDDFIHVFANIMEGRTTEQKAELSASVVSKLKAMFPEVPILSMNIRDFEKATYCNKSMV